VVCPKCKPNCPNNSFHEMVHGNMSLSYCVRKVKQGEITGDLIERMESEVARIDKALKSCIRGYNESA